MRDVKEIFVTAILLAAGNGSRLKQDKTKQKCLLLGKSILRRAAETLNICRAVDAVVVVVRSDEKDFAATELRGLDKVCGIVVGGENRRRSAEIGFDHIPSCTDIVLIHDAARCLITAEEVSSVVRATVENGAASAVLPIYDTVKRVDTDGKITETIPRSELLAAATPQGFEAELYRKALYAAQMCNDVFTDDNSLVEKLGVRIVPVVTPNNKKITDPNDLAYAECVLSQSKNQKSELKNGAEFMDRKFRIGHGYDVHRLVPGRRLVLGGVVIPHSLGLDGHSDADVLVHSFMDAILGALCLGDIGKLFPDSSDEFLGSDSLVLLKQVWNLAAQKGAALVNADITLVAQKPKISCYTETMRKNMADILGVDISLINVKATTEERLGFTGREEGIAAHAVVLLSV